MIKWKKARKKPVEIRYREIIPTWHIISGEAKETIRTEEGEMEATKEDYIIEGIYGEIYPIKKYIFEQTYEVLE